MQSVAYSVPGAQDIPDTKMGERIQRGEAIFLRTPENAKGFSGNPLSCANCHLDAGRLNNAAPMWVLTPCTLPTVKDRPRRYFCRACARLLHVLHERQGAG